MATGSWSSQTGGPTIYTTGYWYGGGIFSPPSPPPANATITTIYWEWSVLNYRSDLEVWLCDYIYGGCLDVSYNALGGTSAFSGRPASNSFILVFRIPGNGSAIYPYVYGQQNYFILNWEN